MEKVFKTDINLKNNQIKEVVLEKLSVDPSGHEGRIYFNTDTKRVKIYKNENWIELDESKWEELGTPDNIIQPKDDKKILWDIIFDPPTKLSDFENDEGFISDYTVTEGDVTGHQEALSITESQISDLQNYLLNISNESIFDLSDVEYSTDIEDGQILKWENDKFIIVSDLSETKSTVGTEIHFYTSEIYNSPGTPATANITDDLTGAKIGIVQKIYHNHSTAPTFPPGWVRIGEGEYVTGVLNIIYAEWVSGTRVEYWIIQEA